MTVIYAVLRQMGLPVGFLRAHAQHACRRERKVARLRGARFINLARATRTQMRSSRCVCIAARWTRREATRRDQVLGSADYIFSARRAARISISFYGTGEAAAHAIRIFPVSRRAAKLFSPRNPSCTRFHALRVVRGNSAARVERCVNISCMTVYRNLYLLRERERERERGRERVGSLIRRVCFR